MIRKVILATVLIATPLCNMAASLMENPKLTAMLGTVARQDLNLVEKEIKRQCIGAWQVNKILPIFGDQSSTMSMMLPLDEIVSKNIDYACQCLSENTSFQGTLVGAFHIKTAIKDNKKAETFFKENLRSTIRSCFWNRAQGPNGKYVSPNDINQRVMMKQCKSNYTQHLLKTQLPNKEPTVEQVLATASVAEDKCSCLINQSLVSRITGFTVELMTYEMSANTRMSSIRWRQKNLNRYLLSAAGKCGIH